MNDNIYFDPNNIIDILNNKSLIIDLRDPSQYVSLHIKDSINIPYDTFEQYKHNLPYKKPIYLICYSGNRSYQLAKQLREEGYQTYSIQGGFYSLTHSMNYNYY